MTKLLEKWDKTLGRIQRELDLSQEEMAHIIGVSCRSLVRWFQGDVQNPEEVHLQNVQAIDGVIEEARKALNADKLYIWFKTPNPTLADLRPLDLLGSRTGQEKVKSLLGKIRWAIPT